MIDIADTSEQWKDRAANIAYSGLRSGRGGTENSPKCFRCGTSTRHLDGAVFCSKACEHSAATRRTGTIMQQHVAKARTVDPFFASQARILDGGLWPDRNVGAIQRRVTKRWEGQ